MRRHLALLLLTLSTLLLAGCDVLGIETATTVAARKDAEGRAIGAACRHAARAIEQCYAMNKRADKAAMFAGWREMNDYMRENSIAEVPVAADPAEAEVAGGEPAPPGTGAPDKPEPARNPS